MVQYCHAKILLAALVLISILTSIGFAQDKDEPRHVIEDVDCNTQETTKAILDFAYIEHQQVSAGETMFIIARLGTGETSRKLNQDRLFALREYLFEYRKLPANRLVTAEGDRVKGPGQVEIYVNGKLYALFKMKRYRTFTQNRYCKLIIYG